MEQNHETKHENCEIKHKKCPVTFICLMKLVSCWRKIELCELPGKLIHAAAGRSGG